MAFSKLGNHSIFKGSTNFIFKINNSFKIFSVYFLKNKPLSCEDVLRLSQTRMDFDAS